MTAMVVKTLLLILFLGLSACVAITSEPSGADVIIKGHRVGKTPYGTGMVVGPFYSGSGEIQVDMPGYAIDSVKVNGENLRFILRPTSAEAANPAAKEEPGKPKK